MAVSAGTAYLQVIDSVDVTDPSLLDFVVPEVSKWSDPIVIGGMSNGVAQLHMEVRARARDASSLLMLRLHGHGAPGLVALSHGSRNVSPGIDPETSWMGRVAGLSIHRLAHCSHEDIISPASLEILGPLLDALIRNAEAAADAHGPNGEPNSRAAANR